MQQLPEAFAGLARYRQFIVYRLAPSLTIPGATDKIPTNPFTLYPANPMDPDNWMDFETARSGLSNAPDLGIGFVFTSQDPFFFLDIDKCLEGENWSERATQMLEYFDGAAVEISQSGSGLHIIGSGTVPSHACKNKEEKLELYTEQRFVALTGSYTSGSVDHNCQRELEWLVTNFFDKPDITVDGEEWSHRPVEEWNGPWDDDLLIDKAMQSQSGGNVFGNKASFADLFEAREDVLAAAYPETGGKMRPFDESSADMALAQHLAFWTGKNHERIKNIMLRSKLVRDKWDRDDYIVRTVQNACALQGDVYNVQYKLGHTQTAPVLAAPREVSVPVPGTEVAETPAQAQPGMQFLTAQEQPEYFRGCVYIRSLHRILVPDGSLLKPEQFRVTYGGYNFCMDAANAKTTKSAWEAFTESQAYKFPKVHHHVFRPELPPLKIFSEEGVTVVNSYVPIDTERAPGDPSPFLNLLYKLLPSQRDREILLCYMAALVQYPGQKFMWAPVLQGVEGNGKTTLLQVVAFCVGRRYSHFPNAQDIANKFNAWLAEKLFIGLEEVYVGDKREVLDALKPMITNSEIEIQRKGQDQEKIDNRANFMLTTNHMDGIKVTTDTRRWCMLFTAQQTRADKQRDGLEGSYFPNLYHWLNNGGYAIINGYLREFPITEEFNPAGQCVEAPTTSSSIDAQDMSLGSIEQEIKEAIEMGESGFKGGWVSSIKLDELLQERHLARLVPRNKRRRLMNGLGYDWHPALGDNGGRVNRTILQEGAKKPVLFYKMDQVVGTHDAGQARNEYIQAQGYPLEG